MNFLIGAQLPRRLAYRLLEAGYDTSHTLDLPNHNRTTDAQINELSVDERWVVITKNADLSIKTKGNMDTNKVPEVVECSKCRRRLDPHIYIASPSADTPPELVTRVVAPTHPYFSIQCTCGQYTVFTPWSEK